MKPLREPSAYVLRPIEWGLWIGGCCALCYCILALGLAIVTQARLARIFERVRATKAQSAPLAATAKPINTKSEGPDSAPRQAAAFGRLEIPRIDVSAMVLDGISSRTLQVALGHFPGTSSPGEQGNVVIAGHRDTFFRPLRRIRKDDEIILETVASTYHYRVSSLEIVDPGDTAVLRSHKVEELTLITCYPFSYAGRAPKRFIVHAVLEAGRR